MTAYLWVAVAIIGSLLILAGLLTGVAWIDRKWRRDG